MTSITSLTYFKHTPIPYLSVLHISSPLLFSPNFVCCFAVNLVSPLIASMYTCIYGIYNTWVINSYYISDMGEKYSLDKHSYIPLIYNVFVCIYVCTFILYIHSIYTYISTLAQTHTHIHIYTHIHKHLYTYIHIYICVCVCVYIYVFLWLIPMVFFVASYKDFYFEMEG